MRIAIILPVYEGSRFIERAILSIAKQEIDSQVEIHLLVVDDSSSDSSIDIVVGACESGLFKNYRLACNLRNCGRAASRNIGVEMARHLDAQWVTFLDQDDWLPFDSLNTRLEFAGRYSLIYGLQQFQLLDSQVPNWVRPEWLKSPQLGAVLGALLIPMHLFDILGLFDERLLLGTDDLMWLANARRLGLREYCIKKVVLFRGIHNNNSSKNPAISRELLTVVRAHASNSDEVKSYSQDIAVIVAVYNETKYLEAALAAIFSQSLKPAQIILIDDGSLVPVSLPNWILEEHRIELHRLKANKGLSYARNYAFKMLKTEIKWIALLDADDIWPDDRLMLLRRLSVDNDAIFGLMSYISSDGMPLPSGLFKSRLPNAGLIKRDAWTALGGFTESVQLGQPMDFMIRFSRLHLRSVEVPVLALQRRIHATNMTRQRSRLASDYFSLIREHIAQRDASP